MAALSIYDSPIDRALMVRASRLALRGWGQTSPNPMVGAVIAQGSTVVGEGFHARFGGEHAEVVALLAAGDLASGATAYVTLEPCAHHGQTPPCTGALIAAGIARVVCASLDPNPAAAGGIDQLRTAGIQVDVGVREEMLELNAPFFHRFRSHTPWTTLKLAVSLDGAISDAERAPGWLTGRAARREVHHLRAGSDAIAVGIGTVLSDDPALTVRAVRAPRLAPRRVVFDDTAKLPLDSQLVRTARAVPTIVIAGAPDPARTAALQAAGVRVIQASTLHDGVLALRGEGVYSLLVEGGARLAGAFLRHSLLNRLIMFQAPVILGAGALNAFSDSPSAPVGSATRLRVVRRREVGDDVMTIFALGDH